MSVLQELREAAANAVSTVAPGTVRIGRDGGRGLGLVIAPGLVVTSAHNLRGRQVTVAFAGGVATGTVRAVDADGDLAVIAVETGAAPPVAWSDAEVAIGDPVWTVTLTPQGATRVTPGSVSAVGRPFRGPGGRLIAASIEHTALLARGSSGGALVGADGRVVGLNTHRLGDGFYLALPTDAALQARLAHLVAGRSPTRRRLGVALAPAHAARRLRAAVGLPERDGLLVRGVEDGSPAATADIRRGDLIVAVDETPVVTADDLFAALDTSADTLQVTIVRGGDEQTVTVDVAGSDVAGSDVAGSDVAGSDVAGSDAAPSGAAAPEEPRSAG
jgi:serine protease Do